MLPIPTINEVRTQCGTTLRLLQPAIGAGAHAAVYAIADHANLAVRIFHCRANSSLRLHPGHRAARLHAMLQIRPPELPPNTAAAWPVAAITGPDGSATGYLMPKAPPDTVNLKEIIADGNRELRKLTANRLHEAAAAIHRQGFILGDVNDANIGVTPTGTLWFYDVESWQFTDPEGNLHHAMGATLPYLHPSIVAEMKGVQRNCTAAGCPGNGYLHAMTPSCRPRQPYHDRYGIDLLCRKLLQQTL